MYQVKFTAAHKKSYKRLKKHRGWTYDCWNNIIEKLQMGIIPLEPQYRDHRLTGQFAGCHECHIRPDWLLVLTLVETGSHADFV